MHPQYQIRSAEPSDFESLVAFTVEEARETEGKHPDLAAVRLGVQSGLDGTAPSKYWVALTEDGEVVGSVSIVNEWSNFRGGYYWWVQSLFIVPSHRGRGLVDSLLDFVADSARDAGALDLRLYVLHSNKRAISAYRRCGFEATAYTIMTRAL